MFEGVATWVSPLGTYRGTTRSSWETDGGGIKVGVLCVDRRQHYVRRIRIIKIIKTKKGDINKYEIFWRLERNNKMSCTWMWCNSLEDTFNVPSQMFVPGVKDVLWLTRCESCISLEALGKIATATKDKSYLNKILLCLTASICWGVCVCA